MAPTLANGKICYLELPAVDVAESAAFYREVFRWTVRKRGDGAIAFDDTTGEVSGAFVTGRKAAPPGLLFYIMVESVVGHSMIARRGVAQVLSELVETGWIDSSEIADLAEALMRGNAARIFNKHAAATIEPQDKYHVV